MNGVYVARDILRRQILALHWIVLRGSDMRESASSPTLDGESIVVMRYRHCQGLSDQANNINGSSIPSVVVTRRLTEDKHLLRHFTRTLFLSFLWWHCNSFGPFFICLS